MLSNSEVDISKNDLVEKDLSSEKWCEYDFDVRTYRIDNPVKLIMRDGGTTHRVIDSEGIVHCLPAPGNKGCVLRWKSRDNNKPVEF